jgi:hypothetical protein
MTGERMTGERMTGERMTGLGAAPSQLDRLVWVETRRRWVQSANVQSSIFGSKPNC